VNADDEIGCVEAERALVGSLLLGDTTTAREVLARLRPTDLTDPRLRTVAACVRVLLDAGTRPCPTTVQGQLRRSGAVRSFTAGQDLAVFVVDLAAAPLTVGSATAYLTIVLEHAWWRRVEEAGIRLQQAAGTASVDVLADLVTAEFRAVAEVAARWQPPAASLRLVGGAG